MTNNKSFLIKNPELTINFIMERQKTYGGFGASPELPATLQDTFFAVKALKILEIDISYEKLSDFIHKKITEFKDNPLLFILAIELLKNHFFQINSDKIINKKTENLQNISAIAGIARFIQNNNALSTLQEKVQSIIKGDMILEDIYYCFSVLGKEKFPKFLLTYILDSQNCDGRFGFKPNTTSFVENAYFAVKILENYANLQPNNCQSLQTFLISCKKKDGGFSRASGGSSSLESTYYSLYVLNYIKATSKN